MKRAIARVNARLPEGRYASLGPSAIPMLNPHGERPREARLGELHIAAKEERT
jgi:hypothetical protein